MIIWSGFGFVVPLLMVTAMVVGQLVVDGVLGDNYYTRHTWPKVVACTFTAIVLLIVGLWMNKPTGKVLVDKETGEEVHLRPNHSFFFIPVQWWSAIVIVFCIYLAVS